MSDAGNGTFDLPPEEEFRRLRSLEAAYDPATFRLLDEIGLAPGWRCLEVGAGAGSVALGIAGRGGRVWALDQDVRHVRALDSPALRVIELALDGETDPSALPAELDLVHSRLLLDLMDDPVAVIELLISRLAPGGWIVLEEFDDLTFPAAEGPAHLVELHRRVIRAKQSAWTGRHHDNDVGRKVLGWLERAGLTDLRSDCSTKVRRSGTSDSVIWRNSLRGMRTALLAADLAEQDFDEYLAALDRPGFAFFAPLMVRSAGQRPS